MGGAEFFGQVLATYVIAGVSCEGNSGIAALLRAVVHQAVFADVEIARSGAAAPVVGESLRDARTAGFQGEPRSSAFRRELRPFIS